MEDGWDADNFVPPTISQPAAGNKWEGEDEEEDVKESWEDEEEEKKDEEKVEVAVKSKPKKSLQEKIAEKERLKREEYEQKIKEQEEMTPEERMRRQQESDLRVALETTFNNTVKEGSGLDGMNPSTKEEFQEFTELLSKKIQSFSKSDEYPVFAEELIRNICVTLTSLDLKKIKTTVDNMYLGKQKIEKGDKAKKSKGKGKAKLKMEGDNQVMDEYAATFDYDDYDDFM